MFWRKPPWIVRIFESFQMDCGAAPLGSSPRSITRSWKKSIFMHRTVARHFSQGGFEAFGGSIAAAEQTYHLKFASK